MLPQDRRLKKDRDFRRVMQVGSKQLFGPLLVFTAPSETDQPRFGVVVSKKVSLLAVDRNKIRRQLAHLLRPIAETFPTNRDVVIVVLRSSEAENYQKSLLQWQKKSQSL